MKTRIFYFLVLILFFSSYSSAQFKALPYDPSQLKNPGEKVAMPSFNKKQLQYEDSINEINKVGGMRFAQSFDVNYTLTNSGKLETLSDGKKRWTLEITSDSAYSLNLIFSKYHLLEGDTLNIYNALGIRAIGPLTQKNNIASGVLPLVPVDGSTLKLEFIQTTSDSPDRKFELGSINHDYRGFRGLPYPNSSTYSKDSCSQNASCVSEVAQVKQSVCLLIINGTELCSGTLVNNTSQDGTPYLLTAAHCFDVNNDGVTYVEANGYAPTVVAFFNYEVPNCDKNITGSIEFTIGGATLKALSPKIDFALLKLSSKPPVDYRPYYAGWNISTSPSAPFRGIHHPYGKVKVVAKRNSSISTASYSGMLSDSHWYVARWDIGTTQPGSSGSGLFDANLRLVGALTGGESECVSPVNDYYSRLNKAWNYYPYDSLRLKPWLDPTSSGVTSLSGFNPYGNDSALRYSNFTSSDVAQASYLTSPASGLSGGQNSLGITEYGERFGLTTNAYLYGLYLIPCKANASQTTTNVIDVKVYAGTVPNSSYLLDEKQLKLNTLQWVSSSFASGAKVTLAKNENYLPFDTPVAVGDTFTVVYTVPYENLPADSFAIYTAKDRGTSGFQSAVAYYGGQWVNLYDITSTHTSFWIDPVIRYDSSAIAVDTSIIERTKNTVIFPNPAKDIVYVMTRNDKSGPCTVTLYNSFGQLITTIQDKVRYRNIPIDLQGLSSGIYIIRVAYRNKTETHKLIIK